MSIVEKALERMQAAAKAQQVVSPLPARSGARTPPAETPPPVVAVEVEAPPVVVAAPAHSIVINRGTLRQCGMLPPEHEEGQINRQYRTIKRPLIANALGRGTPALPNGRLIMVGSAMPGDGKTFTSMNLALSIAKEKDINVLLVDADVSKRHLSTLLGIAEEPGLMDSLRDGGRTIESMLVGTDMPSLSILPAGRRADNATELLASNRMEELARQLLARDPSRIVVFDSPPLLLTTESQALAHVAGQIVVVVRAGVTPQSVLRDAVTSLGERPISLILNQSVERTTTGYYYYGYGDSREGSTS